MSIGPSEYRYKTPLNCILLQNGHGGQWFRVDGIGTRSPKRREATGKIDKAEPHRAVTAVTGSWRPNEKERANRAD